jgi:histidinol-phosphate phosphatase family protein
LAEHFQVKTAAILAGGRGERLRSAVAGLPKVLAPIAGRAFLTRLLDQLTAAGIQRAVLCTGFLAEQVEQAFGPCYEKLSLLYSREIEPLDTGGALRLALKPLDSDPMLVLNGDSFCDVDFSALVRWHYWKRSEATIALAYMNDAARFGRVTWVDGGRITRFEEKAGAGSGWINAGIYLLSQEVVRSIKVGCRASLERDCFPVWAEQGRMYGFPGGRRFLDIGTPESYAEAKKFFWHLPPEAQARKRPCVLVDLDCILMSEQGDFSNLAGVELLPGLEEALKRMQGLGLGIAVIANRPGIARGCLNGDRLELIQKRLRELLDEREITPDGVYFCSHLPGACCPCCKPAPGLVDRAAAELGFDPKRSYLVGDKLCDIELGRVVGATTFFVQTGHGDQLTVAERAGADYVVENLMEAANVIERLPREDPTERRVQVATSFGKDRSNAKERVRAYLLDAAELHRQAAEHCSESIVRAAKIIRDSLRRSGKLLLCGNGGSAAQCQHMAAELVSALNKNVRREGLAAIALTTDTSILTAISNDFGFDGVFERQVEALGQPEDVLLAISTSGKSPNTVRAIQAAKRKQMPTIALVGATPGELGEAAQVRITMPAGGTQHMQEVQLAVGHLLCMLVEEQFLSGDQP